MPPSPPPPPQQQQQQEEEEEEKEEASENNVTSPKSDGNYAEDKTSTRFWSLQWSNPMSYFNETETRNNTGVERGDIHLVPHNSFAGTVYFASDQHMDRIPGYSTFGLRQRSFNTSTNRCVDFLQLISPYVLEFVGTMFIGLTISLSEGSLSLWGPLAYGSVLLALSFVGAQISGAHYNPAVTIAMYVCGKIRIIPALGYLACQLLGGIVAGILTLSLEDMKNDNAPYPGLGKGIHGLQAVVCEALFTTIVVKVMLDADERKLIGEMRHSLPDEGTFFGLGVGMATIGGGIATGEISGAIFNPAVGTGLLAVHGHFERIWIYWAGPVAGAMIASGIWKVTTDWDLALLDMPFNQTRFDVEPCWRLLVPYVVEFMGTFMLCFVFATTRWGAGAGVPLAPLAIGSTKVAVVYMASQSSMAHFNPAVTTAALMCGLFTRESDKSVLGYLMGMMTAIAYIVAQLAASFAAAEVAKFVLGKPGGYPLTNGRYSWVAHLMAEALFSFLLAYVVLITYDSGGSRLLFHESKNRWYMYSLASGFALMAGTVAVGDVSGAALNPAAGTGLPLVAGRWVDLWVYWSGPMAGALLAAAAFSIAQVKSQKNVDLPFYRHGGLHGMEM
mmetsp:Transcript_43962/g.73258  ORF Transcript_43962/g.73258 Transcript_43962/m.73258 type:complete len:615 (+) Transcript_43962:174-2018(+)